MAKEIKKDRRADLFAATPPLAALKMLLSLATTEGIGYERGRAEKGMKLEFLDIRERTCRLTSTGTSTWHCQTRTRLT